GGAAEFFSAGSAGDVARARGQRVKDGVEVFHDAGFAADHHAVAACETPDAAAGADVDVVNFLGCEIFGAADVVDVVRVAAVDQDIVGFEEPHEVGDGFIHDSGGDHQPDRAGL